MQTDAYSAFECTPPSSHTSKESYLSTYLKKKNISKVVIVGLATDYCVKATALHAANHFKTVVVADGCRAVGKDQGTAETWMTLRSKGIDVVDEL